MVTSMTAAVAQAVDTLADVTTALPALPATRSGVMTALMWSIVILLIGLTVIARWVLYAGTVRMDRLHR